MLRLCASFIELHRLTNPTLHRVICADPVVPVEKSGCAVADAVARFWEQYAHTAVRDRLLHLRWQRRVQPLEVQLQLKMSRLLRNRSTVMFTLQSRLILIWTILDANVLSAKWFARLLLIHVPTSRSAASADGVPRSDLEPPAWVHP
jgi:hypothetical protein